MQFVQTFVFVWFLQTPGRMFPRNKKTSGALDVKRFIVSAAVGLFGIAVNKIWCNSSDCHHAWRKETQREAPRKHVKLKGNFRILQPRLYFHIFLCQSDSWREQLLKLVQCSAEKWATIELHHNKSCSRRSFSLPATSHVSHDFRARLDAIGLKTYS